MGVNTFDLHSRYGNYFILRRVDKNTVNFANKLSKYNIDASKLVFELVDDRFTSGAPGEIIFDFSKFAKKQVPGLLRILLGDRSDPENAKATDLYVVGIKNYFKHVNVQQQTGALHEICVAIFLTHSDAKINSMNDVKKYAKISIINNKQAVEAIKNVPFKTRVVKDAKEISSNFLSHFKFNIKSCEWIGGKNAKSTTMSLDVGPADIIAIAKNGKQIPISIKFGAGQLKNPGIKGIVKTLMSSYKDILRKIQDSNFMSLLDYYYHEDISKLVQSFVSFSKDSNIIKKVKTWQQWWEFKRENPGEADKIATLATTKYKKEWIKARKKYLVKNIIDLFSKAFESAENEELEPHLLELYKNIFTIVEAPYYYISDKQIFRVPSEQEFKNISKNLNFTYSFKAGADFYFVLKIRSRTKDIDLLSFEVGIRWFQKQMMSDLGVKVTHPKFLASKEEVFNALFPQQSTEGFTEALDVLSKMNHNYFI